MGIGVIVVRVKFCGEIVAERAFRRAAGATVWARRWESVGKCERDGPQFTTEWGVEYL